MRFNRIEEIVFCFSMIGLLMSVECVASVESSVAWQQNGPFQLTANLRDLNQIMSCPAHAHGTLQEAAEKLRKMVAELPVGRPAGVWVCRTNQLETLKVIGPLADNMMLNIMAITSNVPPDANEVLWPRFDHPFVNHIRLLRKVPNTRNLYAVINLVGDYSSYYEKRQPSFEEIKWMTYAAIGSGFQGVYWRNTDKGCAFMDDIHELEKQVLVYKDDLGTSVSVGWVADNKQIPVSARASDKFLFVTVLNPDYFKLSEKLNQITLPILLNPMMGQLEIHLPVGVSVSRGQTVSGKTLELNFKEGKLLVDYSFYGGGDMMVFELKKESTAEGMIIRR